VLQQFALKVYVSICSGSKRGTADKAVLDRKPVQTTLDTLIHETKKERRSEQVIEDRNSADRKVLRRVILVQRVVGKLGTP